MSRVWKTLRTIANGIDRSSVSVGRLSSFLVLLSIAVITVSVVLRYFFSRTYVALDEIQYYFYSIMFLFGFSYVLKEDGHIRVDIFFARFSDRKKALINLLGGVFLTIPWAAAICYYSFQYFLRSYHINEKSTEASGLPALYILKFILFLAFVLLLFQGMSLVIRQVLILAGRNGDGEETHGA